MPLREGMETALPMLRAGVSASRVLSLDQPLPESETPVPSWREKKKNTKNVESPSYLQSVDLQSVLAKNLL